MARLSALSGLVLFLASGAQAFVPSPLARMNTAAKVAPRSKGTMSMVQTDVMTLTRYMIENTKQFPDAQDLEVLMSSIQVACKTISNLVCRAGINDLTGLQGGINVQGEEQKKLDVISNDVLKNALRFTGKLGVVASEEEDHPVLVEEAFNSKYVAVFDPLDGSSNIDAAISTGTIFGIFLENDACLIDPEGDISEQQMACLLNTLQPGSNLVASGYVMYSSSTIFVLTLGNGVNGFTLDPQIGEFVLTHPNIKIPKRGKIYSFNEANYFDWDPKLQDYVNGLKKKGYSSRYIGSMVGDIHRTLLYGGVFGYPSDKKNVNGKLRLLYEAAPMGFIMEQAGGKATTGTEPIHDLQPKSVHQRVPTYLGSPEDVDELVAMLK